MRSSGEGEGEESNGSARCHRRGTSRGGSGGRGRRRGDFFGADPLAPKRVKRVVRVGDARLDFDW